MTLKFTISDSEYVIKRTLKRSSVGVKQESGTIIEDGVATNMTPVELKAKIYEILGYPKSILTKSKDYIYRYTVYTPQEEMKKIIFEDTETRLDTLRRIFEIDKYKQIRENSYIYMRELKSRLKTKFALIENYDDLLDESIKYDKEISLIDENLKELEENQKIKTKEHEEKKQNHENIKRKIDEYKDIEREIKSLEEKLSERVKQISRNNSMTKNIEEEVDRQNKELSEIKIEKFDLIEEDIQKEIEKIQKNITEFALKKDMIAKELSEAIDAEDKFNLLSKEIEDKNKTLEILKKEIIEIDTYIKSNENISEKLLSAERESKEMLVNKSKLEQQISDNNSKINKINSIDDCPYCLQKVGDEHKDNICSLSKKNIEVLERELKEIDAKINLFDINIQELKILQSEYDKKTSLKREISVKIESINDSMIKINSDLKELSEKKDKIDLLKTKKSEIESIDIEDLKKTVSNKNMLLAKIRESSKLAIKSDSLVKSISEKEAEVLRLKNEISEYKRDVGQINAKKLQNSEAIKILPNISESLVQYEKEFEAI